MKNLTNIFLKSAPSRIRLPFGVNTNVILKSVDNDERRNSKTSMIEEKNCYMTFSKVNPEDKSEILAEVELDYFNISVDKNSKYASGNFIKQFNQLIEIAKAAVPKDEFQGVVDKLQNLLLGEMELFNAIKKTNKPDSKLAKKIADLQQKLVDSFVEEVSPYTGENSDLMDLLIVVNKEGYLELPKEDRGFVAKSAEKRKINIAAKYVRLYENKNKPKKDSPDSLGATEEIIPEEELAMDDDNLEL